MNSSVRQFFVTFDRTFIFFLSFVKYLSPKYLSLSKVAVRDDFYWSLVLTERARKEFFFLKTLHLNVKYWGKRNSPEREIKLVMMKIK